MHSENIFKTASYYTAFALKTGVFIPTVIPAKAGIHNHPDRMPAFAGMMLAEKTILRIDAVYQENYKKAVADQIR